ncbi:hypothetical protein O181_061111 [Austropuccinia psidii MF-1]|uniref:Uncharacterized protein n=1 Tax=Austropuccinia psidii MF-1 TaxID=1389203 RepID=A0A9Q3HX73_9BASI|nr:hypothetical protein [Austropuccinia psidii MF-1]
MLTRPHPPSDETPTLPPHLHPHHSLRFCTPASSSPWLTVLMLLQGPQAMPLKLPSPPLTPPRTGLILSSAYHPYACSAHLTCLQCCLPLLCLQCPPDMPLTPPSRPLMILTLLQPPQDETTMPLTTPYTLAPPPYLLGRLPFLHSRGALKICLRRHPQPP